MTPRVGLSVLVLLLAVSSIGCSGSFQANPYAQSGLARRIRAEAHLLRPLYERPPATEPQDWLAVHVEPGQTFEQYLEAEPRVPDATRNVLYVQPSAPSARGSRRSWQRRPSSSALRTH